MRKALRDKLYSERNKQVEADVMQFLRNCERPRAILRDHAKAFYYYSKYQERLKADQTLVGASRPYFLYIWLCSRDTKFVNLDMRNYKYFSDAAIGVDVSDVSYRDFTQMYADPIVKEGALNIHYECLLCSEILCDYPVSLKSLLDRIKLLDKADVVAVREGSMAIVKTSPGVMEDLAVTPQVLHNCEEGQLIALLGDTTIKCDMRVISVVSKDVAAHTDVVTGLQHVTGFTRVENRGMRQCFAFPSKDVNYQQFIDWLDRHRVPYHSVEGTYQVTVDALLCGAKCDIADKTLDAGKCYYTGDYEVYRAKGERVLEVVVYGNDPREDIEKDLLNICAELDKDIAGNFVDPLTLDVPNIARLRATNSIVFDSMYCRKAPPEVQPMVITAAEVPEHVARGKMVLTYEGLHYTTKDHDISCGQDYIGMINRFGDYDPTKPYVPIIRTYKTNHLLSKNFKEFKAYLLRHSKHPNIGLISREDLLLPKRLEHLHRLQLYNKDPEIAAIHSKKTLVTKTNKVFSAEIPDHVKSLLGTSSAKRVVISGKGSKLLECCAVAPAEFLAYVLRERSKALDTLSLSDAEVTEHINSGKVDHRLYGKLLEDYTGYSLLVFSIEGLVPYRHSRCSKDMYVLLFVSTDDVYYRIVTSKYDNIEVNMRHVRDIVNKSQHVLVPDTPDRSNSSTFRRVDYTLVAIRIVSYITNKAVTNNMRIKYTLVSEKDCVELVECCYCSNLYYEGVVKDTFGTYNHEAVSKRGQAAHMCATINLVIQVLGSFVAKCDTESIEIYSPVDMSKYHAWNLVLEDCLYYSPNCYYEAYTDEVRYLCYK